MITRIKDNSFFMVFSDRAATVINSVKRIPRIFPLSIE